MKLTNEIISSLSFTRSSDGSYDVNFKIPDNATCKIDNVKGSALVEVELQGTASSNLTGQSFNASDNNGTLIIEFSQTINSHNFKKPKITISTNG